MDFKQWRDESEGEEEDEENPSAKLPRLVLSSTQPQDHYSPAAASSALPLFVPQPTITHLSPYSSDHSTTASATKFHRMGAGYFSTAQWQELELQALIFRHMIAGADIPTQLLHLVKKSLVAASPPPSYYISNPLHQYHPHYQPAALVQTGYWGRAAMDPEPGRCRRTDGKKWRCSRDVVASQKYCERHMHRGRNRSRKPVEIPTFTTAAGDGGGGGGALKTHQGMAAGASRFSLHLNPRPLNSITENCTFEMRSDVQTGGDRTLRRFFDDWPRSDSVGNSVASATNLSILMPENPPSDFSLKLGTGDGDEPTTLARSGVRDGPQLNWGGVWESNRVAPMGGPLAEALRSSGPISSPTSVLHRRPRSSASEASHEYQL